MNLHGKIVLLTGASGGIGRAIAQRLATEGAILILVGIIAGATTIGAGVGSAS